MALPRLNGYYGRGRFNQPIPLHGVRCSGQEDSLLDCGFRPRPLVGVTHSNDAGVDCFTTNGKYRVSVGYFRRFTVSWFVPSATICSFNFVRDSLHCL